MSSIGFKLLYFFILLIMVLIGVQSCSCGDHKRKCDSLGTFSPLGLSEVLEASKYELF